MSAQINSFNALHYNKYLRFFIFENTAYDKK